MDNNNIEEILRLLEESLTDKQRVQLDILKSKMSDVEDLLVALIIPDDAVTPPTPKEAEQKLMIAANMIIDNAFIKMIKVVNERWPREEKEVDINSTPKDRALN